MVLNFKCCLQKLWYIDTDSGNLLMFNRCYDWLIWKDELLCACVKMHLLPVTATVWTDFSLPADDWLCRVIIADTEINFTDRKTQDNWSLIFCSVNIIHYILWMNIMNNLYLPGYSMNNEISNINVSNVKVALITCSMTSVQAFLY